MKKIAILTMALLMVTATSVQADLVACWHLDGNADDSSGNDNDGTVYGATYDAGYYGQALRFDGDDDYVDCGSDTSLDLTTAITIEAWVCIDDYTFYPSFVSKGDVGNYAESYALFHSPTGQLAFLLNSNGTSGGRTIVWGPTIPLVTWIHVAGTYDGTTMQIYIGSSPVGSIAHSGGINITADPVMIGQSYRSYYPPQHSTTVDGLIDEVNIWDEALTDITGRLLVDIDIKPGSDTNPINQGSKGVIPVAILSSSGFDATTVIPGSFQLGGAGVAVRGKGNKEMAHDEDVNGDGLADKVVQVETEAAGLWTTGEVILTAETTEGVSIQGSDVVVIVPAE